MLTADQPWSARRGMYQDMVAVKSISSLGLPPRLTWHDADPFANDSKTRQLLGTSIEVDYVWMLRRQEFRPEVVEAAIVDGSFASKFRYVTIETLMGASNWKPELINAFHGKDNIRRIKHLARLGARAELDAMGPISGIVRSELARFCMYRGDRAMADYFVPGFEFADDAIERDLQDYFPSLARIFDLIKEANWSIDQILGFLSKQYTATIISFRRNLLDYGQLHGALIKPIVCWLQGHLCLPPRPYTTRLAVINRAERRAVFWLEWLEGGDPMTRAIWRTAALFVSDGLFTICSTVAEGPSPLIRFLTIMMRLPLELQVALMGFKAHETWHPTAANWLLRGLCDPFWMGP